MKILTARLASEDRFWSRTTPSLRGFRCHLWNLAQTILGVGPTFHRSNLQMEIPPSPLSPKYRFQLDSIYENFVGNLAVISETREEASFEVRFESFLRLTCRVFRKDRRAFGDRSEGKRFGTVSWSTRDRLSGRLWLSLVRLSMFRHLFIDLLEYGGVWVLSMLNFYSSCLRPYFGKVLDYDNMSLDIIEYPYLVTCEIRMWLAKQVELFRRFGPPCSDIADLSPMSGNFAL
ncbi:hypothetical protein H5410_000302 [Solanum commersonii]|uniref:Uncharacterized protein n=1 Tax=Solanum commersonii TaxID=4109 RepID=A0A9J6AW48_SOLCO|nr:hypothetical protein H5410_000302 [Solanum commersonii]